MQTFVALTPQQPTASTEADLVFISRAVQMTDVFFSSLPSWWLQLASAVVVMGVVAVVSCRLQGYRAAAVAVAVPREIAVAAAANSAPALQPKSVNYHFTRQCNYTCGFCFHTAKSPSHLPLESAKRGLHMLRDAGMEKINFSGGEPLLIDDGEHLGQLCRFCKELGLFVTIVTNGSLMTQEWLRRYAPFIDIVAVSCDSFDDSTNKKIGRWDKTNPEKIHKDKLFEIATWCLKFAVGLKINTVVNSYNCDEDMSAQIISLKPIRWKCFQVLEVEGENKRRGSSKALRNAGKFLVSQEQFDAFLLFHKNAACCPVAESNAVMRSSYFLLDEQMRFLDCSTGAKVPSVSIFDDLPRALAESGFAPREFKARDGDFYEHMTAKPPAAAQAVAYEKEEQQSDSKQRSEHAKCRQHHVSRTPPVSACDVVPDW